MEALTMKLIGIDVDLDIACGCARLHISMYGHPKKALSHLEISLYMEKPPSTSYDIETGACLLNELDSSSYNVMICLEYEIVEPFFLLCDNVMICLYLRIGKQYYVILCI
ncbi:hypothetical protein L1987_15825 [Smallanthus sonchifolius]|uniref:Uncharacterized protein n=1 Tax=Smallanthus sonchifolius TaxID=185202 RepID=A0ACB9J762_9ASTR|nr:hypothetical protein L1987_15825 [Smallanthus sonchifolius]